MNKQRSWVRAATTALVCLGLHGCYKATFIRDGRAVRGEEHDEWTTFFLFGLVGTEEVDVKNFCPDGDVAVVRTGANFGTSLVSAVTIGIYTPRKVYVTCAKGGSASESAATQQARRLEVEVDAGRPISATLITGATSRTLAISPAGEQAWNLELRGGAL